MKTLNDLEVLHKLRTEYRVPQPKSAKHPLIRALKATVGIPVYHYRIKRKKHRSKRNSPYPISGSSPDPAIVYDGGALYVMLGNLDNHSLLHELCHAVVAKHENKLHKPNFGLESGGDSEEIDTYQMELYLGFISGLDSWIDFGSWITEYGDIKDLDVKADAAWSVSPTLLEDYTMASIREYLNRCRKIAMKYPDAKAAMEKLGISMSSKALDEAITKA